jgi:hypothetical protein
MISCTVAFGLVVRQHISAGSMWQNKAMPFMVGVVVAFMLL